MKVDFEKVDFEKAIETAAYITGITALSCLSACMVIIVYMFAAYVFFGMSW